MCWGQAPTHALQPVQDATEADVTPGGRGSNGAAAVRPLSNWRRDMLAAAGISGSVPRHGRAGGPGHDLIHPDEEPVAADKGNGKNWPNCKGKQDENDQLAFALAR